jgi:selenide,water dikinase
LASKKHQQSHHLLLTRPLGFGPLWLTRSHPSFQSDWLQEEWQTPLLPKQGSLAELGQDLPEVVLTLIEDWGVWGHLLPALAGGSQAVFNYRELPKWAGFETCIQWAEGFAGDQLNWERVAPHVSFKREDVSMSNRLLWDPLSSGALLISVPEKQSSQALCKVQQMGYTRARIVGCVRPQSRKTKLVLSDWTP